MKIAYAFIAAAFIVTPIMGAEVSKTPSADPISFTQVVKDATGAEITTQLCGGTPDKPDACQLGTVSTLALNFSSDPRSPPPPSNAALGWKVMSATVTGQSIELSVDELSILKGALLKLPAGGLGYAACRLVVPPDQCSK